MGVKWLTDTKIYRSRVIIGLCGLAVALAIVGLIAVRVKYKIHRIPIPKREKLADCTTQTLSFPMTVRYDEPYQILLGLPHTSTGQVSFSGEVEVRQNTQLVARIPIRSEDMTWCNWLDQQTGPGLMGFILTWSRTNRIERLSGSLVRGQTYDVQVTFSQLPPEDSSLWLSSIGKVGDP